MSELLRRIKMLFHRSQVRSELEEARGPERCWYENANHARSTWPGFEIPKAWPMPRAWLMPRCYPIRVRCAPSPSGEPLSRTTQGLVIR